jgi:hypothetical protein
MAGISWRGKSPPRQDMLSKSAPNNEKTLKCTPILDERGCTLLKSTPILDGYRRGEGPKGDCQNRRNCQKLAIENHPLRRDGQAGQGAKMVLGEN